ncbi:urea/short chain-amides ABC transporter permease [Halosimplex carlsbadense 2-9-1]|uniref:Urea/short chain-amides ABC transporter permease n=1 Tax=Halosimplex carlsbadense 2-9-1 TaxID=797114 RepID=M0D2B7_9EURY|nr:urea/short chain-amides ABC transporter permease [Halosimplex carlsbadense]ELZ29656.1 urea/short chain-amides ABC transporter permease [Halosimplex carlsbadense 2-9-1]
MATESATGADRGAVARIRGRLEGPNTVGNSRGFWLGFAVAVLALVAYPLVGNGESFSLFLVLALLGLSLSLVWGYSGVLSFGQVVFFGVGGYTFGVVSINLPDPTGITAAAITGVVVGGVTAALLGYFMFYGGVRDVYVTIITLVSTMVLQTFMAQTAGSEWTIGEAALGGFNGMPAIPLLELGITGVVSFQFVFNTLELFVPGLGTVEVDPFYYLALAALVAAYLGLRVLVNSDFGRVMVAVREDQDRTQMFGYDVKRVKLLTFTVGGALAALSGVLYAARNVYIDPQVFALWFATLPVIWVSVGGRKSLLGAVIATIGIEYFRLSVEGEMALVVLGALLLVFILALPGGIVPWIAGKLSESSVPVSELDDADAPAEVSES